MLPNAHIALYDTRCCGAALFGIIWSCSGMIEYPSLTNPRQQNRRSDAVWLIKHIAVRAMQQISKHQTNATPNGTLRQLLMFLVHAWHSRKGALLAQSDHFPIGLRAKLRSAPRDTNA